MHSATKLVIKPNLFPENATAATCDAIRAGLTSDLTPTGYLHSVIVTLDGQVTIYLKPSTAKTRTDMIDRITYSLSRMNIHAPGTALAFVTTTNNE